MKIQKKLTIRYKGFYFLFAEEITIYDIYEKKKYYIDIIYNNRGILVTADGNYRITEQFKK